MKGLFSFRKIILIVTFVFICGIVLQISRSQWVLTTTKQNEAITQNLDLLQPVAQTSKKVLEPEYCLIMSEQTKDLSTNITKTLDYMRKEYKEFDTTIAKVDFDNCPNILLATSSLKDIGSIEEIEDYVKFGGNLFFMTLLDIDSHYRALYRHFGIVDFGTYIDSNGIHLNSNILLGATDKTFLENDLSDSSISVVLANDVEPLAENLKGNPLLWKNQYGDGAFMTLNGTFLKEKVSRGVITGMLGLMPDTFIYPIFNSKVFFIDDFPSPIAKGKNETIFKEYKKDLSTFYQNIWWPDMIKAANRYNLTFTGGLIESYTDSVTPPFNNVEDKEYSHFISFGRELIQGGGELGFHGYNHQSLTLDTNISKYYGYNAWNSEADMKKAIRELISYTKSAFPSYTVTSYIPPSNVLSAEGRKLLKEAMPDLMVISSLYSEDGELRSYVQEFEIAQDGVIEMPRISSGYFPTESNQWEIANAITSLGVFSHFIHPDDVISEDRSKGGWSDMYEEFNDLIEEVYEKHSWLRPLTATKAAFAQASALHSTISIEQTSNKITGSIDNFSDNQYFILRTIKDISAVKNGTFEKIDTDTFLIMADSSKFEITYK